MLLFPADPSRTAPNVLTEPVKFVAPPLLIAGPTASGKSAYALARAAEMPSVIINADSMQVYRDLGLVTARPDAAEASIAPHRLYGHVDGAEAYSAGRYVREMTAVLAEAAELGLRPIIVGGTGLYFHALLDGLSPIPEIPADVRQRWRLRQQEMGAPDLHRLLSERDPEMATRLSPSDGQRIVRALEVLEATGRSLAQWQAEPGVPVLAAETCERRVIVVDRGALNARADARFDRMITAGALEEVAVLIGRGLAPDLPVMRALGVRPLADHLDGQLALDAAIEQAKRDTRAYIKRQRTWLKRNMSTWKHYITQQ